MEKSLRQRLLDEMFKALYFEGYHACNLNTVLERAGTSKGGMYHHFRSKQELAVVALDEAIGSYINNYWVEPLAKSENPLQTLYERIQNLPDAYLYRDLHVDFQFGSPLNNAIQELSPLDPAFTELFQKHIEIWEAAIVQTFSRAAKLMRIDVDFHEAASFIVSSIEGSFGYAKVYGSKVKFERMMHQLIVYIQALVRD